VPATPHHIAPRSTIDTLATEGPFPHRISPIFLSPCGQWRDHHDVVQHVCEVRKQQHRPERPVQVPAAGGQAHEQPHPSGAEEDPRLDVEQKWHRWQKMRPRLDVMRDHPRKAEADPGLVQQTAEDAAEHGATFATARKLHRGDGVGYACAFNR